MSSSSTIQDWQKEVEQRFPQMKVGQTRVLAQASYAMMMTMHCGTTTISHWLAAYLEESPNTVRQRIREWFYEAKAKRGRKRRAINVEQWFGDLLRWVLAGWEGEKRVVLALDATNNGTRFTSLSIGVVIQGCLIPVAWKMLTCNAKGAWKPHWLRLLALLRGVIPPEWQVVAMTDAGLYASLPDTFWCIKNAKERSIVRSACEMAKNALR